MWPLILAALLACGLMTALMMAADGQRFRWWRWVTIVVLEWPVMLYLYGVMEDGPRARN